MDMRKLKDMNVFEFGLRGPINDLPSETANSDAILGGNEFLLFRMADSDKIFMPCTVQIVTRCLIG